MIEYDVIRHPSGKVRITEAVNGEKHFVTQGKRKYFDDAEAAAILLDKQRSNERKAKYWLACDKNRKMKVNI